MDLPLRHSCKTECVHVDHVLRWWHCLSGWLYIPLVKFVRSFCGLSGAAACALTRTSPGAVRLLLRRMTDDALRYALSSGAGGEPEHVQFTDASTEQKSAAALLQEALFKASARIIDLFREWDSDGSGTISRDAFQRAMAELEHRAPVEEVDALFLKWRSDKTGVLEINELERLLRRGASVMKSSIDMGCENKHALRTGAVDKAGSTLLQGFAIDAASELSVAEQLRDALSKAAVRVIDLFREWDDDNSGMVSKEEFRRGMAEMGLKASIEEVDKVFDAFDPDGSGSVELQEFGRMLRRGSSAKLDKSLQAGAMGAIETKSETKFALRKGKKPEQAGTAVLRGFDLDEDSDESIAAQLRGALMASGARVIDLFREWDADGDGKVTRAEFHRAMGLLRFGAPKAEIDVVFASWDPDGSGVLELKELERLLLLRKGSTVLDAAGEAEARARAREGAAAEAEAKAAEAAKAAAAAAEVTEVTARVEPGEGEEDEIWVSTPRAEPIEPSVPHQPSPPVPRLPPRSPRQRHMEAVHEP